MMRRWTGPLYRRGATAASNSTRAAGRCFRPLWRRPITATRCWRTSSAATAAKRGSAGLDDPKIEQIYESWLGATDPAEQTRLEREYQLEAFAIVAVHSTRRLPAECGLARQRHRHPEGAVCRILERNKGMKSCSPSDHDGRGRACHEISTKVDTVKRRIFLAGAAALPLARPAIGGTAKTLLFVPQSPLASLDPVWTSAMTTRNVGFMIYDVAVRARCADEPEAANAGGVCHRG